MQQRNSNVTQGFGPYEPQNETAIRWDARTVLQGVWGFARTGLIFICSFLIIGAIGLYGYHYINSNYITPPGVSAAPPQEIIVAKGMSLNKISLLLEDKKLVRSAKVFKYYVDFSGYASKIKAGHYVLDGSMTLQQIMDKLAAGKDAAAVTAFTIPEGSTIEQTAALLQKQKIIVDSKKFLELCKAGKTYTKYAFIQDAIKSKDSAKRYYVLEGYLFPAKYEIYVGATEDEIIGKMLAKTNSVITDGMMARAKQLDMTVDQVLTLASIIEKEGKPDDFAKVSAVFHNRLKAKMALGSDVTVQYILKTSKLTLSNDDIAVSSPYNTYKNKGLPLGPISNPGQKAIHAALYPDEQYVKDKYLYFVLTDPATGKLEFNKTLAAHEKAVKKYRPLWEAYDKEHSQ